MTSLEIHVLKISIQGIFNKDIKLSEKKNTMSMIDSTTIIIEIQMIDTSCSSKKEFTKLILMNPCIVLYLTINHVDSCHVYVRGPLT